MHYRVQKLEEHIITCNAKLVVIDSVASVVRKEYDPSISHNMAERSSFLARLAAVLKSTAEAFSIPVCLLCLVVCLYACDIFWAFIDWPEALCFGVVCRSVCAYIRSCITGWRHSLTGLQLISSCTLNHGEIFVFFDNWYL